MNDTPTMVIIPDGIAGEEAVSILTLAANLAVFRRERRELAEKLASVNRQIEASYDELNESLRQLGT